VDEKTKKIIREISDVCKKHKIIISPSRMYGDSGDATIEILKITKRPGRLPSPETIFECDCLNQHTGFIVDL